MTRVQYGIRCRFSLVCRAVREAFAGSVRDAFAGSVFSSCIVTVCNAMTGIEESLLGTAWANNTCDLKSVPVRCGNVDVEGMDVIAWRNRLV